MSDTGKKSNKASFSTELSAVVRNNTRQYTMIAALLLIWVVFTILTGGNFLKSRNLSNLFMQMVTFAIMTSGMVLVMVAGNIDLSVGSVCGTLGALAAWLMSIKGVNPVLAILITLAAGFIIGCWHGFWIAYRKVPAFIVTLASMMAFKGVTLLITKGVTIGEFSEGFKMIGQGYIPQLSAGDSSLHITTIILVILAAVIYLTATLAARKKRIKNGFTVLSPSLETIKIVIIVAVILGIGMMFATHWGIPYAIAILFAVAGIYTVITTRTPFGRHVYAIGGNIEAARLSGVNIKKTLMLICISMGVLTGVASLVFTARLNAATTAAGNGFELDVIAACIIGGTSTSGGIGTVFGAVIGALVMASLDNGMSLMNLPIMYQYIIKGFILVLAVWIDIANRKK
jgi:D-xylose transport system permease protein